jgi:hypothetical protein
VVVQPLIERGALVCYAVGVPALRSADGIVRFGHSDDGTCAAVAPQPEFPSALRPARALMRRVAIRLGNITIDCDDVRRISQFWSTALERPLDDGASEWFASIGGADPDRAEPAWYFEKVPEKKVAKNRMHVDVIDSSPDAVDRLVGLGATVLSEHEMAGHKWHVLQDPEGNEFCLAAKPFTG